MSGFYLLETLGDSNDDKLAFVEDYVTGLEMKDWKTKYGHRTASDWPPDASMVLRKTSGKKIADLVGTITNNLIVSQRLRALIEQYAKDVEIEYLPVQLHDHRNRLLSAEHVIVNPVGTRDCLDLKASDILWDKDDSRKALSVRVPVISAKKADGLPALFRIKEKPASYVVSFTLAKPIHDGAYTNVRWQKLEVR